PAHDMVPRVRALPVRYVHGREAGQVKRLETRRYLLARFLDPLATDTAQGGMYPTSHSAPPA
ncbi:hypothetical protein LXA19_18265, partial [Erwinia amylovora]|uniref:hypothetical protein n=1 Tax=Erwinia amylovora TaxID=552 RepID=UPI0020BDDDFF